MARKPKAPSKKRKEAAFVGRLVKAINGWSKDLGGARARQGQKVDYASYSFQFAADGAQDRTKNRRYQTDVFVYDVTENGSDIPLVIIECKVGKVTTHDLQTYGVKADSHRTIYPYLRYGMVIGEFAPKGASIQYKMLIHGQSFDFIAVMMKGKEKPQIDSFKDVLADEIEAARTLRETHQNEEFPERPHLLHRRLEVRRL